MISFLRQWLITFLAVIVAVVILPGWISYADLFVLAIFAAVLALLNAIVRPILVVLTLPVTVLTMGLFLLVINAVVFWLAAAIMPGISVRGFVGAFLGALVVSIIGLIADKLLR